MMEWALRQSSSDAACGGWEGGCGDPVRGARPIASGQSPHTRARVPALRPEPVTLHTVALSPLTCFLPPDNLLRSFFPVAIVTLLHPAFPATTGANS